MMLLFTKQTTETKETYFNIYGLHIDSDSFMKWDAIAGLVPIGLTVTLNALQRIGHLLT